MKDRQCDVCGVAFDPDDGGRVCKVSDVVECETCLEARLLRDWYASGVPPMTAAQRAYMKARDRRS